MNKIKGTRILVTGGAGLVGSHIVDLLIEEGAGKVIVYDSLIRGKQEHLIDAMKRGDVVLVQGDLRDKEKINENMKGVDYVFHQAASWLRQCQQEPRLSLDVNIIGTFNLLEACVDHKIKKLVAASSSSVYGDGSYFPTDEKHPFNNDLFYGASKIATEQFYRAFYKKYGLNFVALRYLNVYGPKQPSQAAYMDVIMHFLNKLDNNESPIIFGDGTETVDLVYVRDVARANIIALKSDLTNEFLNVASGKETTLTELAIILARLTGKPEIKPIYQKKETGLVQRRYGCPKKAKELLGFEATITPEEGLKKVIEWRRKTKSL